MSFLLPAALLGLLTIPLILLLHILRNRRKEIPISSLRLWRDLEQRKHGALPRGIPLTLMLLLQLIIAAAITLALAQPASSFLLDQPQRTIFVLDTSTSMTAIDVPKTATGQTQSRFEVARNTINDYISAMGENDSVAVVLLSSNPQLLLVAEAEEKEAAWRILDKLTPGGNGVNLAAALTLTTGLIDPQQKNEIVLLTDANYPLDSSILPDVLASLTWHLIPADLAASDNQALFDVSTRRMADGRYRIFARVVNYSDQPVNQTLRLTIDDLVSNEDPLEIAPQSDILRAWTLSAQAETASLEIIEPDALSLDNRADLLLLDSVQHQVLLISDKPEILIKTLAVQPGVELTVVPSIANDYTFADYDLIVFDGLPLALTTWPVGNVLVVNPPLGHPLLPADNYARDLRPDPETASALLTDMDLSGVFFSRVPRVIEPEWATVDLRSINSEADNSEANKGKAEPTLSLILHGEINNSQIMVWAFDLEASNLPARLALPLLTANTLSALLAPSPPATIALGDSLEIPGNFSVETPDNHRLFLNSTPSSNSDPIFSQTKKPGLYKIYNKNDVPVAGFAVHAASSQESNLQQRFQPDTLTPLDAAALPVPDLEIAFKEFWPWLAGLALIIVVFEGWFAWRR